MWARSFTKEVTFVRTNYSLSSDQQKSELDDLQFRLKHVYESVAEFENNRKRTLSVLHRSLEREKDRIGQKEGINTTSVIDTVTVIQEEVDSRKKELTVIESDISRYQHDLEQLKSKLSKKQQDLANQRENRNTLVEYERLKDHRESLANEIEILRTELADLECTERELSEWLSNEEG